MFKALVFLLISLETFGASLFIKPEERIQVVPGELLVLEVLIVSSKDKIVNLENAKGTELTKWLYLVSYNKLKIKEEGQTVNELGEITLAFTGQPKQDVSKFKANINGVELSIHMANIEILSEKSEQGKELIILEQNTFNRRWVKPASFIIFLLGVCLLVFIRRKKAMKLFAIKKREKQKTKNDIKNNYIHLILSSQNRLDYEKVYATRKKWSKLICYNNKEYSNFLEILNKYQYKKSWDGYSENEIKSTYLKFANTVKELN